MKKLSVLAILLLAFVLAACSPAAPTAAPTVAPATVAPTTVPATAAPTAVPEPIAAPVEPAAAGAIPEIRVEAADYSYVAPQTISPGWVRIVLTNSGAEPHHVQFLRLNAGESDPQSGCCTG